MPGAEGNRRRRRSGRLHPAPRGDGNCPALGNGEALGSDDPDWSYALDDDESAADAGSEGEIPVEPYDEEAWAESWRPQLPADGETALDRSCAELNRLLFDEGPSDPGRIAEIGAAILSDPEPENVDRATGVEQWLAQAILAAPPRSDPLIDPAIARFRWDKAGKSWRRDHDADAVLRRRQDVRFLAGCEHPFHRHHAAVTELRGPPRERVDLRALNITRQVKDFLAEMDSDHPGLYRDFDQATLDWWRSYFQGRHLPVDFWAIIFVVPVAFSFLFAIFLTGRPGNPLLGLLFYPVALLFTFGLLWLIADLTARARERADRRMYEESAGGAEWLVLASLALPVAAALLPDWPGVGWAFALASFVLLAGAHWLGPTSGPFDFYPSKQAYMPAMAFVVSLAMPVALPMPVVAGLIVPLGVMCWLAYWGADSVRALLLPDARRRELTAMLAAALLLLGYGFLLWFVDSDWPPDAYMLVLVPVIIVAAHLAMSASMVETPWLEWPIRTVAILFYFFVSALFWGAGQSFILTLCVYAFAYTFVKLSVSIHHRLSFAAETA